MEEGYTGLYPIAMPVSNDPLVLFLLATCYFRLAFADCPSLLYNSWTEAMYEWP